MPDTEPSPSLPAPCHWRAYIARPDGDQPVDLELTGLGWAAARELLVDWILPWLASDCECCREAAMECLYELDDPAAPDTEFPDTEFPDTEFPGDIDGTHYMLTASR